MDAIFYLPDIDLENKEHILPQEEAKHAIRVLRMREGDSLLLTNGKGYLIKSRINSIEGKKCIVTFDEAPEKRKQPYKLHMAIAPTKNINRYKWLLEKATEIGVSTITPILTSHSERRNVNLARLEKILVAAMKQSQKAYLPILVEMTMFNEFVTKEQKGLLYLAHCDTEFSRESLVASYEKGKEATIMIGPEGDFSKEEIQYAINKGFQSIHLGNSRLRTETAAVVACSSIYQLNF
ncbi:16S rRNA (uracil1498-N3)-methyltransferase [Balneicella halophila]|uniref:Ribosomal RNA small subunit methyltransferase E n=1 Tax=Balneicella halophila TaxID=1537566 RepID=A0A7L4URQ6_BALHA|nr:16S rRNA (uracil(1498)-N(3))-methyltransferase [Balneicella halophila]PVX51907.1 16S rRNA (uracil1498-N3)-methyltransferase [Balneicella halophila]